MTEFVEKVTLDRRAGTAVYENGARVRYTWTAPLKSLDKFYQERDLLLLPPQVRWVSKSKQAFLLEFPPSYQRITISDADREWYDEVRIPLPWTVYFCDQDVGILYVFARPQQIRSLEDQLCWYHLSNIQTTHQACAGYLEDEDLDGKNPIDYAFAHINAFWLSTFNGGMYTFHPKIRGTMVPSNLLRDVLKDAEPDTPNIWVNTDYFYWLAEQSIEDILAWDWRPNHTIRHLLESQVANAGLFNDVHTQIRTSSDAISAVVRKQDEDPGKSYAQA